MQKLFREKSTKNNKPAMSFEKYRRILQQYKFEFDIPKTGKSKNCIAHVENTNHMDYDHTPYKLHCKRKEAARKLKDRDKSDTREDNTISRFSQT